MREKRSLQWIIAVFLGRVTLIVMILIMLLNVVIQIIDATERTRNDAENIFKQMERILDRNTEDLNRTMDAYSESCIQNAQAIAYIIDHDQSILGDIDKLKKIASFMEVDEIHIFNSEGVIFFGTHPEYYGYSFDSGEQMNFFKPMLTDKSLKLVQEITPNTAEGKLVQYSALWNEGGDIIVQVGMYPVSIMRLMEKNELPYIFSILLTDNDVSLYAVDPESNDVLASTDLQKTESAEDIGLRLPEGILRENRTFYEYRNISGKHSFVAYRLIDGNVIAFVIPLWDMLNYIMLPLILLFVGLLLVSFVLILSVTRHIRKYVFDATNDINSELRKITDGDLDTTVSVESSIEFSELSSHINAMVNSLLANTEKLSYIFKKSGIPMGAYEHQSTSSNVRYTEFVAEILHLDKSGMCSKHLFMERLGQIYRKPEGENEGVYEVESTGEDGEKKTSFIYCDESSRDGEIVGVISDVTTQITEMRRIERERDMDALTGLLNRRGFESRIEDLKNNEAKTGYCAFFMLDADGLKETNDRYGHGIGDMYLKKVAEIISGIGSKNKLVSRMGGDEFVLFLYGYDSSEELKPDIDEVFANQDTTGVMIADDLELTVSFSAGYSESKGCYDIEGMTERADEFMYENKRSRKGGRD